MRILVSGSTGFVGTPLVATLRGAGHQVVRLVRGSGPEPDAVRWDPAAGRLDATGLEGMDAVVHLAGENIAAGRWTAARKRRIRSSRELGTRLLAATLAQLEVPPRVLVSASAIGYYGDRGDELLTEESAPGDGFLSEVCQAWESAADAARERGIRVVHPRIGVVLSPEGGALARMLPPFRLGLGGVIGGGRQWVSWITLEDLVAVLRHVLENDEIVGPLNAVAPEPVTNRQLTGVLGRVLGRPTVLPLPAAVARLVLGEMAEELLLASTRVAATRLLASGFSFDHPEFEGAVRHLLARRK